MRMRAPQALQSLPAHRARVLAFFMRVVPGPVCGQSVGRFVEGSLGSAGAGRVLWIVRWTVERATPESSASSAWV
jgi:hypothetical protein